MLQESLERGCIVFGLSEGKLKFVQILLLDLPFLGVI